MCSPSFLFLITQEVLIIFPISNFSLFLKKGRLKQFFGKLFKDFLSGFGNKRLKVKSQIRNFGTILSKNF